MATVAVKSKIERSGDGIAQTVLSIAVSVVRNRVDKSKVVIVLSSGLI